MKTKLTLIPMVIGMLIAGFISAQSQTWSWSEDELLFARDGISATSLDDSVFYSGGRIENGVYYNVIEIYDVGEHQWDLVELESTARWVTSAASGGGKVFFAGGNDYGAGNNTFDIILPSIRRHL